MSQIAHSDANGVCVKFHMLYPMAEHEGLAQWQAIMSAVTDAMMKTGGSVSYHHGIGRDHAPWPTQEKGTLGVAVIRALRTALDPDGIMNPGKLT